MNKLLLIFVGVFLVACSRNSVDSDNANSSHNEQILLVEYFEDGITKLCTMNPDDTHMQVIYETVRHVTPSDVCYGILDAIWSPDKAKILMNGGPSPSREVIPLWIVDGATGKVLYQLTPDGGNAVWLPDGSQIMFAHGAGLGSQMNDLYQITSDGTNESVFFHRDSLSILPWDISPDGTKLIVGTIHYYTNNTGTLISQHQTGIFDLQTHHIRYLYHDSVDIKGAHWTNHQDKIYYIHGSASEPYDIYFYNLNDSTRVNVTTAVDLRDYYNLTVSPDNTKFAFSKKTAGVSDIYVLDINSQSVAKLTDAVQDSISYTVMDWK